MSILAVQAIRKMRGGSQSQLMLGADSNLWVVKFQNNPQHRRVLANELIATRLAKAVGLSVPATESIEVTPWLVEQTPDIFYELGQGLRERYAPGLQFGSRFVGGLMPGHIVDYLPETHLHKICNPKEFAGILCFDKWTANCDGRQVAFARSARELKYAAFFIDQGHCFGADKWCFPDAPLRGVYCKKQVYAKVTGWDSFEPWLSNIEMIQPSVVWDIAREVPPEWYDKDEIALERLIATLLKRRSRVRELVLSFRNSELCPFPCWT